MPHISPPHFGAYLFDVAEPVLAIRQDDRQDELKRLSELCMALHYVRLFYPPAMLRAPRVRKLARLLLAHMHDESLLRLLSNTFILQQHVTPYVFLRSRQLQSDYYEGLIASFLRSELEARECTPYRRLERAHLLYKLKAGPLTSALEAPIFADADRIFFFNRDLSYALTHTLFYCTDFSHRILRDQRARFACLAIAAASFEANDVDLFFEACLCLMGQGLSSVLSAEVWAMVGVMCQRNAALFDALDPLQDYHPLLVFDLLRGAALLHHGIDVAGQAPELSTELGQVRLAGSLCDALKGKDLLRIEAAYLAYVAVAGPEEFVRDMVASRLRTLRLFASTQILFEREFTYLGRRDALLYGEYMVELDKLKARHPQFLS